MEILKSIDENIWVASAPLTFMGLHFGCRMTVVRMGDELLLHSPIELTAELKKELDAIGKVRWAVAPNRFHHLHIGKVRDSYPEVQIYLAPGLVKKRKDLLQTETLPYGGWPELKQVLVAGAPMMNEVVFYHTSSKTLICCDLLQNMESCHHWGTRLYLKMVGIYQKPGLSLPIRMGYQNRKLARESLNQVLEWDFQRIILSHGEVITENPRETLERVYTWLK